MINLTNTVDQLANDKGELLEKCQKLIEDLVVVKKEYQQMKSMSSGSNSQIVTLTQELKEKSDAVSLSLSVLSLKRNY